MAVAADISGNVYIADSYNEVILLVSRTGIITTIAGTGAQGGGGDGGAATSAQLNWPVGVALDISGNVYIADNGNHKIRMVTSKGIISTIAGTGTPGSSGDGEAAISAQLIGPRGIAVDSIGNVYFADTGNQRIRMVSSTGTITTIAGGGGDGDGGAATSASLYYPWGVAVDTSGKLYIAESENYKVRMVTSKGIITTFAGTGAYGDSGDGGAATSAQLRYPYGVAVDISGNVYIADYGDHKIRKVSSTGIITIFAGTGIDGSSGDGGPATSAQLTNPSGVAVDISGNVYIADHGNKKVRMVSQPQPSAMPSSPTQVNIVFFFFRVLALFIV